jgi:phage terminase large subunit
MEFLFTGRIGDKTGREFDIVSKTLPHLRATAIKEFWKYAQLYKIDTLFKLHKTDKTIKYRDRIVHYYSADDEKKVKGRRRDFLWISEADTIDYDTFRQLQMRTNVHTFLDFNPDDEYIWINEELEQKRALIEKDITVIQSSYLDNVFLNEKIIHEIETLRNTDPEYWQIYGLGNYGSIAGLIYKNWQEYDVLPERKFVKVYGQDYGFSNSRDAMVEINWEISTRNLYIKECYYELGLSTLEVIEKTKEVNPDNDPVFGDSAEARLMQEIRMAGINIYKPKKTVHTSINLLRSFNLFIHSGSPNLLKEVKRYKWDKKDGKRINIPVKLFDHLMDALAYGATGFIAMFGGRYRILKELTSKGKSNG